MPRFKRIPQNNNILLRIKLPATAVAIPKRRRIMVDKIERSSAEKPKAKIIILKPVKIHKRDEMTFKGLLLLESFFE